MVSKYNREIDRESAHEILRQKMEEAYQDIAEEKPETRKSGTRSRTTKEVSVFEKIMKSPVTNTIAREVTRGILGVLGLKSLSRATRSIRSSTRRK
jgi:hypothetical protein